MLLHHAIRKEEKDQRARILKSAKKLNRGNGMRGEEWGRNLTKKGHKKMRPGNLSKRKVFDGGH